MAHSVNRHTWIGPEGGRTVHHRSVVYGGIPPHAETSGGSAGSHTGRGGLGGDGQAPHPGRAVFQKGGQK